MDLWPLVGRGTELRAISRELETHGVLFLLGDSGCGKSRLMQEYLREVGDGVAVVTATAAARTVAMGAFAAVLPEDLPGDPFDRLQAAVAWLTATFEVVAIDDAHLLDPVSATLVEHLIEADGVAVLATVRRGDPAAEEVQALWSSGQVPRLELTALDRSTASDLVRQALGGPVTVRTEHVLWNRSGGNPLALRELITIALEVGALRCFDDTWSLNPDLQLPLGLAQAIDARVIGLDTTAREVLELVALGDPLPVAVARELGIGEGCELLETRSLVRLDEHQGTVWIRPHHPLQAEAIRAALPTLRKVRHMSVLAAAAPVLAELDPVRAATWQLDAGEHVDAQLLRRAAAIARSIDGKQGLQLARAATDIEASTASFCALAQAAAVVGDTSAVLDALDQAEALADTEEELVEVVVTATRWAGWDPAIDQHTADRTARIRERVRGGAGLDRIDSEVGLLAAVLGDLARADAASHAVLDRSDSSPSARLTAAAIGASLRVLSGRTDGVEAALRDAEQLAEELNDPFHRLHLSASSLHWLALTGRIGEAVVKGRRDLEAASERGDGGAVRVHATWLAMVLELSGALDDAAAALIDAEHGSDQADPMVLRVFVPVIRGVIDAQRGDAVSVAQQLARLSDGASRDIRVQAWGSRAEVWAHALRGEFDAAVAVALRSGAELGERSWHYWAARLYHDLVRIGRPHLATEALEVLCREVHDSAVLVHLMFEHAAAAADADAAALDAVAGRWMTAGAVLLAAEASGQASVRHAAVGRADLAARSAARAQTWQQRCSGAVTPALAGWRSSLTDREREVGWAAAAGHASREIADRLVISVRTVDNHLAAVYRKLGISGRDELAPALGLVRGAASGRASDHGASFRGFGLARDAPPSS